MDEHPKLRNSVALAALLGSVIGIRSLDLDGRFHEACNNTRSETTKALFLSLDSYDYTWVMCSSNPDNVITKGIIDSEEVK